MPIVSFIIPCFRSELTIEKVINEIEITVSQLDNFDYEIICINDCSPDRVYDVLLNLSAKNDKLKIINFAKNMGKHSAVLAGYSYAKGDYIVNLDDDYQSPVNKLPSLLLPVVNDQCDVAIAQYAKKEEKLWKKIGSNFNLKLGSYLMDKPKDIRFENFSVMKRFVAKEMAMYNNAYPFLEGLLWRTTRRIIAVDLVERERFDNLNTGYTFKKSVALFANGFTAFSIKPLRISSITGLFVAIIGFIMGIILIIKKIQNSINVLGYTSTLVILLFLGGLILMSLGLLGEYVGRIYICLNKSPQYVIKNTVNLNDSDDR